MVNLDPGPGVVRVITLILLYKIFSHFRFTFKPLRFSLKITLQVGKRVYLANEGRQ